MTLPGDLTEVGVILKTHGYKGGLKVTTYYDISFLKVKEPVFLQISGKPVPFFTEDVRIVTTDLAIIKLEDIDDDDVGRQYEKCTLLISQSRLPESHTAESEDILLTGFSFTDSESGTTGIVKATEYTGAQILLEIILSDNKIITVPFHSDLVEMLDKEKQRLVMRLPDGLTDVY